MNRVSKIALIFLPLIMVFCFASPLRAIGFDVEKTYESVFVVYAGNALGSGFAVGQNSIITNAHVVEGAVKIDVASYQGKQYKATVLFMDEDADLAVLAVENGDFEPMPVGDLDDCKIGDDIYTIGAPDNMTYTLTKGVISAKERKIEKKSYIQIDAAINSGNSGGPLLNDDGEVLGVNSLKLSDSEGIGLAIPITVVCDFLEDNGIKLTKNDHVAGVVSTDDPEGKDTGKSDSRNNAAAKTTAVGIYALIVALVLSLVLNAVLIVLLIRKRKKPVPSRQDPSERTDFEIDMME